MRIVAYRHAAYDTPWWALPSSRPGRFHRAAEDVVQYLSLHPLGPAAEVLRHHVGPDGNPDDVLLNLWAVAPEVGDPTHIDFDGCAGHDLTPEELVGDDYEPTQGLADRLRAQGCEALIVPSASLPGTDDLILFGVRLLHPYLAVPLAAEEVPTGHLTDGARPAAEAASLVRWLGTAHPSLGEWKASGSYARLDDPLAVRW